MRIALSGGGTGGHIYPALAIAKGLKNIDQNIEILYVGNKNSLEEEAAKKAGLEFQAIKSHKLNRPLCSFKNVRAFLVNVAGFVSSLSILLSFRPDIVIGTGGYVCGPFVLAAAFLRIKTLIHEQNIYPGITNRLLVRFVDCILLNFAETKEYLKAPPGKKIEVVGLPVRPEIITASKKDSFDKLGLKEGIFTLVAVGGSQGARFLNQAMITLHKKFAYDHKIQFLHLTGKNGYEETLKMLAAEGLKVENIPNIRIMPYLEEMQYALAVADLIVGRAGASFLAEILVKGIPSILIPYPYASDNHQVLNARFLAEKGAARMVLEKELSGELLLKTVEELYRNENIRLKMKEECQKLAKANALNDIIKVILELRQDR